MALYICSNCGEGVGGWMGKCPSCNQWNTLIQQRLGKEEKQKVVEPFTLKSLSSVPDLDTSRFPSGLFEFDRVLGGGIVKGAVILLTGQPGIGKSTLLLQALASMKTLYISGEESAEQVKDRASRLGVNLDRFFFSNVLQVEGIREGVEEHIKSIEIVVVDSIQTVFSKNVEAPPGTVSQLRESSAQLIRMAKELRIPLLIVGHVTKEGDIAGPKTLEHMVDTVLHFEGESVSLHRILRAQKNRFGTTDEIGVFSMEKGGLKEVNDPLAFIENEKQIHAPGKAVIGIMEGKRPLLYEIQTLCAPSVLAVPRRVVKGVDYNKVLLLLAVIRKHLNISIATMDVYMNVIGGIDVYSPAADLGIAASLISASIDKPLPSKSLFIGEVGLLGEVRKVQGQDKILNEAKRLSFDHVFSPANTDSLKTLKTSLLKK